MNYILRRGLPILALFVLSACRATASSDTAQNEASPIYKASYTEPQVSYEDISPILSMSCMPCHNRHTIGTVIERLEKHSVKTLDGETRERVLAEIRELRQYMQDGVPVSFTSQQEIEKFLKAAPGEFYTRLQKGVMPPGFAPELMAHIGFSDYKPLTWENRIKLLQYAKPYSKAYMR
jgi:hypothetical protein